MNYKFHILSILLLIISLFIFFYPGTQNYFKHQNETNGRVVLSQIVTDQLNPQLKFTIIKLKQNDRMVLEVYAHMNHGLEIIEKLNLEGDFDAYLMLKDQTTNLVISNVDRDDDLEVIAPTYDKRMKPILNVFKYDSTMEEFKRVNTKFNKPIL